jgi:hypothetical protein
MPSAPLGDAPPQFAALLSPLQSRTITLIASVCYANRCKWRAQQSVVPPAHELSLPIAVARQSDHASSLHHCKRAVSSECGCTYCSSLWTLGTGCRRHPDDGAGSHTTRLTDVADRCCPAPCCHSALQYWVPASGGHPGQMLCAVYSHLQHCHGSCSASAHAHTEAVHPAVSPVPVLPERQPAAAVLVPHVMQCGMEVLCSCTCLGCCFAADTADCWHAGCLWHHLPAQCML